MNDLVPQITSLPIHYDYAKLVAQWLAGRKQTTIATYRAALRDLAQFLEVTDISATARELLSRDGREANSVVLDYRNAMLDRGLSPGTVNVRLAAIKSLVELAQTLGLVSWHVRIKGLRHEQYRDTRGPDQATVARLLEVAETQTVAGMRNGAILRLLYCSGLRRGEIVGLDLEDFDPDRGVRIVGKGKRSATWISIPPATSRAIVRWIACRGEDPGPLFWSLSRSSRRHRLTGGSIARMVQTAAAKISTVARPHGLRHAAITALLDRGHSIRDVAKFSRHANYNTVMRYDDNRRDVAGQLATELDLSLSEGLAQTPPQATSEQHCRAV